jgi:hypothetical protein
VWRWRRLITLFYATGIPRPVIRWVASQSIEVDLYFHHRYERIVGPETIAVAAQKAEVLVLRFDELKVTIRQLPEKEGVPHKVLIPDTATHGTVR